MEWRARMGLGTDAWVDHFDRQAGLSRQVRQYLFEGFSDGPILEVGAGTGAVTGHVAELSSMNVVALDIDISFLKTAKARYPMLEAVLGDGMRLPFKDDTFAAVLCSHYLVWQSDGAAAIREMVRVLRPKGMLAVVAEPDHAARIDYPEELGYGSQEAKALRDMGGDPEAGRKLRAWLTEAGLYRVEVGLIQTVIDDATLRRDFESEWEIRSRMLPDIGHLRERELQAIQRGTRTSIIPIFYGRGYKPYGLERGQELDIPED